MKKVFLLLMCIIFTVSLLLMGVGCNVGAEETAEEEVAEETIEEEKFEIGVLCADFNDKYNTYMYRAMSNYADGIKDIAEVTLVDAENNFDKQVGQAENFISQGMDIIVLHLLNNMVNSPIVGMCEDANIPLVAVNSIPLDEDLARIDHYIGSDSVISGELEMGYLAEQANGKGNVAVILGELTHECAVKRYQGYQNVLAGYPDLKEVAKDAADWAREKALNITENWISSGLDFDIVVCNNDEIAIGVVLGMESQGVDPKPYLIGGIDGTPDGLEYLKAGKIDCTVFQDATAQGNGAIEAAVKILKGEEIQKITWIPFELVTPADYEKYKAKWEE